MKVAILQCDDVLDKFKDEFGNYPEMIVNLLRKVVEELQIKVFDVRSGFYPSDIYEWDLYITTGSKASVYDGDSWIKGLVEFVRKLDAAEKKLVGICFGHQVIALARGGIVEKSEKGWGIGISKNRVLFQPKWMNEKSDHIHLIVSHQDQVTKLPADASVIAESDFCPYFMVQWDSHLLSVQGHPEWSRKYSYTLMNDRRDRIPHERIESGISSLKKKADSKMFSKLIFDFAKY